MSSTDVNTRRLEYLERFAQMPRRQRRRELIIALNFIANLLRERNEQVQHPVKGKAPCNHRRRK